VKDVAFTHCPICLSTSDVMGARRRCALAIVAALLSIFTFSMIYRAAELRRMRATDL
jgi:hypothetical protein